MLTLGTCRKALWKYASSVPYSTATITDVGEFDSKLAQVVERFFTVGTWKSMWNKVNLAVYDNTITLPRAYDTCRYIEPFCGGPVPIYSQFHRFAGWGIPFDPVGVAVTSSLKLIDENAQTFRSPTGTFTLRAVATEVADPGLTFVGGFNQDGVELFGSINLPLINGASNGTQFYTALPYIQKVATAGAVLLYSVDTTTAEATLIATYAPGETIPEYRQYATGCLVSATDDPPIVSAICRLAFVPAITANDLVIPSNLGALRLGLMSLAFEEKVDPANAGLYFGPNYPERTGKLHGAIDLLDAQLTELGAAEQPAFFVSPNFGAGNIVNVR